MRACSARRRRPSDSASLLGNSAGFAGAGRSKVMPEWCTGVGADRRIAGCRTSYVAVRWRWLEILCTTTSDLRCSRSMWGGIPQRIGSIRARCVSGSSRRDSGRFGRGGENIVADGLAGPPEGRWS